MITAIRDNHRITRNAKFFKQITEKCFEHLRQLKRGSKKKEKAARIYFHIPENENSTEDLLGNMNLNDTTTAISNIAVDNDRSNNANNEINGEGAQEIRLSTRKNKYTGGFTHCYKGTNKDSSNKGANA